MRVHTGSEVDTADAMAQRTDLSSVGPMNGGCAKEAPVHHVEKASWELPNNESAGNCEK